MTSAVPARVLALTSLAVCLAGIPHDVRAQAASVPRFMVSLGPEWLGSTGVGGADAIDSGNGGPPLTLFQTHSVLSGGVGVNGSLGVHLARALWIEGSVRYHAATLSTQVSADREGAPDATITEALRHYQLESGLLWIPDAWRLRSRAQFYVGGGGGYLRQLHTGETLAETGRSYYVSGGILLSLPRRQGGAFRSVGLRVEARAVATSGGVTLDDRTHTAPAVAAALFVGF